MTFKKGEHLGIHTKSEIKKGGPNPGFKKGNIPKNPVKKGEVRNPKGINGSGKGKNSAYWKGGPKMSSRRKNHKRRNLGNIELNEWFEGSEFHHLNFGFGVYIPKKLHQENRHSLLKNINMMKINILALDFVYGGET